MCRRAIASPSRWTMLARFPPAMKSKVLPALSAADAAQGRRRSYATGRFTAPPWRSCFRAWRSLRRAAKRRRAARASSTSATARHLPSRTAVSLTQQHRTPASICSSEGVVSHQQHLSPPPFALLCLPRILRLTPAPEHLLQIGGYPFSFAWRLPQSPPTVPQSSTGVGFVEVVHSVTAVARGGCFSSFSATRSYVVSGAPSCDKSKTTSRIGKAFVELATEKTVYHPDEDILVSMTLRNGGEEIPGPLRVDVCQQITIAVPSANGTAPACGERCRVRRSLYALEVAGVTPEYYGKRTVPMHLSRYSFPTSSDAVVSTEYFIVLTCPSSAVRVKDTFCIKTPFVVRLRGNCCADKSTPCSPALVPERCHSTPLVEQHKPHRGDTSAQNELAEMSQNCPQTPPFRSTQHAQGNGETTETKEISSAGCEVLYRPPWRDVSQDVPCPSCGEKLKRQQIHCRCCGAVYCKKCATHKAVLHGLGYSSAGIFMFFLFAQFVYCSLLFALLCFF